MSFSNLRDHCAFALTVLLSENGMESGRLPGSVSAGRMRSSQQSSPVPGMGQADVGKHPGATTAPCPRWQCPLEKAEGTPGCSPRSVLAEQREHLPLCRRLLLLWCLQRRSRGLEGWQQARVPSRHGPVCSWLCLGKVSGRGRSRWWVLSPRALGPPNLPFGGAWGQPRRWRDATPSRVCPGAPHPAMFRAESCTPTPGARRGRRAPAAGCSWLQWHELGRAATLGPGAGVSRPRCQPGSPGSGTTLRPSSPVPAAGSQPVN